MLVALAVVKLNWEQKRPEGGDVFTQPRWSEIHVRVFCHPSRSEKLLVGACSLEPTVELLFSFLAF